MMSLDQFFNSITSDGKITFSSWTKIARTLYEPFIKEVYPDTEDQEFLKKSRRTVVLFKYWGINKVSTLEEAKLSIPVCRYCGQNLALPRSSEPKDEGDEWISVCRCKSCNIKYTQDQTQKSVNAKYGVNNISSLSSMKKLKSQILSDLYQTEKGKEANEKRKQTCLDKYGVTNVSQAEEINPRRTMNSVSSPTRSKNVNVKGKNFRIMHDSEREFLERLTDNLDVNLFDVNGRIFETIIDGKSKCHVVDYNIDDTMFLELKSSSRFRLDETTNEEYLDVHFNIVRPHLNALQRYAIYMRDITKGRYLLVMKNDGSLKLLTDQPTIIDAPKYFGKYAGMISSYYVGAKDMDNQIGIAIKRLIDQKNEYLKNNPVSI